MGRGRGKVKGIERVDLITAECSICLGGTGTAKVIHPCKLRLIVIIRNLMPGPDI